jgi:hypothetical protein
MVKMMPDVTKCPTEWTPEERFYVIMHRYEWIQLCLDYYEEEQQNKKLLKFLESKKNVTF